MRSCRWGQACVFRSADRADPRKSAITTFQWGASVGLTLESCKSVVVGCSELVMGLPWGMLELHAEHWPHNVVLD